MRNQVQRTYNGLGQMITEYQAHSGAVNTGSSPKVQYAYSEMASGANHSRSVSMTYPNGRVIDFNYGVALDDTISRFSALKDGSTTLESYDYLGLGTVVKRGHAQSGVDLTYIKASGESNGDAGDQYTGLDRFGRIADQRWRTSSVEKDRYQYTYDRNGNRLTKSNTLNSNLNESYTYDSLNQLSGFSTTGTTKSWDYDALGNWDGVTTNGSTQTRTHNRQNEITAISGATTPTFDANGNMTKDETGRVFYYDAWNRLQQVNDPTNSYALVVQVHDGLGRRVTETASTFGIDLYYSADWQVIEERNYNAVTKSYVWSPVYVDAMVARDRDTDANGSLDERLYVMHDANFNVTGLVNTSGTVVERYTYDPYGVATVRNGSWTTGSTAYVWQYLHQGGRLSGQSGLYPFRRRDYSPTLGRWVSNDPLLYNAGSNNLYLYTYNSPACFVDPNGTVPVILPILGKCIFGAMSSAGLDAGLQYLCKGRDINNINQCDVIIAALVGCIFGPINAKYIKPFVEKQLNINISKIFGPANPGTAAIIGVFLIKKFGPSLLGKTWVDKLAKMGCITTAEYKKLMEIHDEGIRNHQAEFFPYLPQYIYGQPWNSPIGGYIDRGPYPTSPVPRPNPPKPRPSSPHDIGRGEGISNWWQWYGGGMPGLFGPK